ncbi:MAG TPA: hypothetical protein VMF67_01695 [Rhizomicrobium sp.]|nr:hypothetical protein [Rhizomicrobium sp.]
MPGCPVRDASTYQRLYVAFNPTFVEANGRRPFLAPETCHDQPCAGGLHVRITYFANG